VRKRIPSDGEVLVEEGIGLEDEEGGEEGEDRSLRHSREQRTQGIVEPEVVLMPRLHEEVEVVEEGEGEGGRHTLLA